MKIWIENPFDNLPIEGYRAQRYWLMASAFAEAGHEVVYWTSDFSHASKSPRKIAAGKTAGNGFELVLIPTPPYRRNVCLARIASHRVYARRWLKAAMEKAGREGPPDIVIVSMPPLSAGERAIELKKRFGCRLVVDIMDAWPETFYRLFPRRLRFAAGVVLLPLHLAARRIYRAADLITGVCDSYKNTAGRFSGAEYYRAYHGVTMPSRIPEAGSGDRPRLVYIGNLGRGYDLGTVIEAVREIPGATLDIAGAGEMEGRWRDLAGGSPQIRFHGYLDEERMSALLKESTIGVIPLSDDTCVGLPYKLGDYVANGLKTVTSLGGECAEILRRHRAGAVYRDKPTLIEAVRDLAALKSDFKALAAELDAGVIYREYVKKVVNFFPIDTDRPLMV